jgi:hypothetical protein
MRLNTLTRTLILLTTLTILGVVVITSPARAMRHLILREAEGTQPGSLAQSAQYALRYAQQKPTAPPTPTAKPQPTTAPPTAMPTNTPLPVQPTSQPTAAAIPSPTGEGQPANPTPALLPTSGGNPELTWPLIVALLPFALVVILAAYRAARKHLHTRGR